MLPIGGLKEKALAAQRYGVETVIAPKRNEQDFDDFPEHLTKAIAFRFVEQIDEVLEIALAPRARSRRVTAGATR